MPPRKRQAPVPQRRSQRQAARAPAPPVPPVPPPVPPPPPNPQQEPPPAPVPEIQRPAPQDQHRAPDPLDEEAALEGAIARIRAQATALRGERRNILLESLQEFETNFGHMLREVDGAENARREHAPMPIERG